MLERIIAISSVTSLCLLIITLNVVTPTDIGPFGILVFFGLTYLFLWGTATYSLFYGSKLVAHLASAFTVKKPWRALEYRKAAYFGVVLAASPVILLGLQTVGAVGIYEVLLTVLFVVVGCFYIAKRAV